jgi:hypothetical protein
MTSATLNGSETNVTLGPAGLPDSSAGDADTSLNGALLGALFREAEKEGQKKKRKLHKSWFKDLVEAYLRERNVRRAGSVRKPDGTESEQALTIIDRACFKVSASGAAAGVLSTGAAILTAQAGWATIVTIPVTALSIGGEMFYRAVVHLEMTCDLAELFGVAFDPKDPGELWRVYALAFRTHEHVSDDPGQELVHKVAESESEQVGEAIGGRVLGESVLKNVLPFVSIGASALQNYRVTKRLGDTVRRYVRYQRALRDALKRDEDACKDHLELMVEGFWFIFTADGQLAEEEAATLAKLYDQFSEEKQAQLRARFIIDETGFLERCKALPQKAREPFLHALEVAAAVDKEFTLPEQRILGSIAQALGLPFRPAKVHEMMRHFEEYGVLAGVEHVVSPHPGAPAQHAPA